MVSLAVTHRRGRRHEVCLVSVRLSDSNLNQRSLLRVSKSTNRGYVLVISTRASSDCSAQISGILETHCLRYGTEASKE